MIYNKIKLTENDLKQIVKESVIKILNENTLNQENELNEYDNIVSEVFDLVEEKGINKNGEYYIDIIEHLGLKIKAGVNYLNKIVIEFWGDPNETRVITDGRSKKIYLFTQLPENIQNQLLNGLRKCNDYSLSDLELNNVDEDDF